MIFPPNNLPTASRSWARDVEKYISNLNSSFRSAEINNVSRDSQLTVTATSALTAATQAQQAVATAIAAQADADAAQDAAISANATAISANGTAIEALQLAQSQQAEIDDAQSTAIAANGTAAAAAGASAAAALAASEANGKAIDALNGLGSLDEATSTYKINASNVTVGALNANLITTGSLSADRISGGVIDASDISGVTISGTTITGGTISGAQIYTSNGAGLTADLLAGSVNLGGPGGSGGLSSTTFGLVLDSTNIVRVSAPSGIQGATSDFATILGGDISVSGSITRTALNVPGSTLTGASLTATGALVRSTSSARYKTEIQPLEIDLEDVYAIEPKTFKRIEEVEEDPETATTYPGFIAEELAGTSLDKFVFYSQDAEGNSRPEGIHYPELTAALLLAIKDLNARLEVLESR